MTSENDEEVYVKLSTVFSYDAPYIPKPSSRIRERYSITSPRGPFPAGTSPVL